MNELETLVAKAKQQFGECTHPADLENAKAQYLGKSGEITALLKSLAQLSVEEKKTKGALINQAKQEIESALQARRDHLAQAELSRQLASVEAQFHGRLLHRTGHGVRLTDLGERILRVETAVVALLARLG